ncbi:MAG: hypothetical protein IK051_07165 [Rhodocyclaceae bacterium]|nr:hypothetical protein [Rhodocyclaceae bacterium]
MKSTNSTRWSSFQNAPSTSPQSGSDYGGRSDASLYPPSSVARNTGVSITVNMN